MFISFPNQSILIFNLRRLITNYMIRRETQCLVGSLYYFVLLYIIFLKSASYCNWLLYLKFLFRPSRKNGHILVCGLRSQNISIQLFKYSLILVFSSLFVWPTYVVSQSLHWILYTTFFFAIYTFLSLWTTTISSSLLIPLYPAMIWNLLITEPNLSDILFMLNRTKYFLFSLISELLSSLVFFCH